MIGVPAESAEDAIAALGWIIEDGEDSEIELGGDTDWGRASESLLHAARDYLASRLL